MTIFRLVHPMQHSAYILLRTGLTPVSDEAAASATLPLPFISSENIRPRHSKVHFQVACCHLMHGFARLTKEKRMTRKTYRRWIENKPKKTDSICYLVSGYGLISIGESGDPLNRFRSTLKDKKWATTFLWVNLHQFGIFDSAARKHLEALMILSAAEKCQHPGNEFCLHNSKYIDTLGLFSGKEFNNVDLVDTLLSNFLYYVRSNMDPRGNFREDFRISRDESVTNKVCMAAFSRLNTRSQGLDRVGQSVRCLEMKAE